MLNKSIVLIFATSLISRASAFCPPFYSSRTRLSNFITTTATTTATTISTLKLWNPAEEAEAPLPDGWREEVDERTGQLIYINMFDGTRTSERPIVTAHEHVVDAMGNDLEIECNPVTGDCYPV